MSPAVTQQDPTYGASGVLLVTSDATLRSSVAAAVDGERFSLACADDLAAAIAAGTGRRVDVAIVDAARTAPQPGLLDELHRATDGCMIICIGERPRDPSAYGTAKETVAAFVGADRVEAELVSQLERVAAIREHRRELEACEEGEKACVITKPVSPRSDRRRRRTTLIVAAIVVVVTAVAVPVVVSIVRSTSRTVTTGVQKASDTMDAINRVEGYLRRDEERELRPPR
jgi:DNA-binding NtrC family response regulator